MYGTRIVWERSLKTSGFQVYFKYFLKNVKSNFLRYLMVSQMGPLKNVKKFFKHFFSIGAGAGDKTGACQEGPCTVHPPPPSLPTYSTPFSDAVETIE